MEHVDVSIVVTLRMTLSELRVLNQLAHRGRPEKPSSKENDVLNGINGVYTSVSTDMEGIG